MPEKRRAAPPEKRKGPAAGQRTGSHKKFYSAQKHSNRRGRPQAPRPRLELCVGLRFVQRLRDGRTFKYEVVGAVPYVRVRDGKTIRLHTIRGRCAKCEAPFLEKAGRLEPRYLSRHCGRHRTRGNGHG